mgnify:CR=1 FL=1
MLALGCDHGGYELMQEVKKHLEDLGFVAGGTATVVATLGGNIIVKIKESRIAISEEMARKIYGKKVAEAVARGEFEKGILICGTGIGISIAANKVKGIRAALCTDCFCAEATRLHNDANILAMGGRVVGPGLALKIVDTFLDTPFSGDERHIRRIEMIEDK